LLGTGDKVAKPAPPKVRLSSLLKAVDKTRVLRDPVDATTARKCIRLLRSHRTLTFLWCAYLSEVTVGILKRRGVDPLYPLFHAHAPHSYNPVPEWATSCAARLAQFRGALLQGLCLYYRANEEYTACTKFSTAARSLTYYLNVIKLHVAQGNFKLARNALYYCLRRHYARAFPDFDLTDETAMPEPLDILPVNKVSRHCAKYLFI
jgi:hypothetical protein